MTKKAFLIGFLAFILAQNGKSQLQNHILESPFTSNFDDTTSNTTYKLNLLNLLKNNEYYSNTNPGQTFFGYQLHGNVLFKLHPNIQLSAGLFLQKDFGNNPFKVIQPTLSLYIKQGHWITTFGTLNSATSHQMIDPMYDYDRTFYQRIENGNEVVYKHRKTFFNVWTTWDKATYRYASNYELITVGAHYKKEITNKTNLGIIPSLQATFHHKGGQLVKRPGNIVTLINTAVGGRIFKEINSTKETRLFLDGYFLNSIDFSPAISQPYKNGHAYFFNAGLNTKKLEMVLSYWEGIEFVSGVGNSLYNSVGLNDPYFFEQQRRLLGTKLVYKNEFFEMIPIDLRLEVIWDYQRSKIEYNYGFFMRYNLTGNTKDLRKKFQ